MYSTEGMKTMKIQKKIPQTQQVIKSSQPGQPMIVQALPQPPMFIQPQTQPMQPQVQLIQPQAQVIPPQPQIIVVNAAPGANPVPVLIEPRCCCGCGIFTAAIVMAILHVLPIVGLFYLPHRAGGDYGYGEGLEKLILEHKLVGCAIFGLVALAYAILGCVRTEEMCYVAGTINHLVATCWYVIAIGFFIFSGYIFYNPEQKNNSGYIVVVAGVVSTIFGFFYSYIGFKFQEFGDYLIHKRCQEKK